MPKRRLTAGYRRLLLAQIVSGTGDWFATVALLALVYEVSGSAVAVGGMLALRLMPGAVAGPIAATLAHRWDRRRTMVAMDVVRAAIVVIIPLGHHLAWILGWVFAMEMATLVYLPARDASTKDLVTTVEDLPVANGLLMAGSYGTLPISAGIFAAYTAGPQLSGVPGGHLAVVFWIDALTFLFSAAMISTLTVLAQHAGSSVLSGRFRDALGIPLVRRAIFPVVIAALGLGTVFSLGIVYITTTLGAGESQFAVFIILFGVGAVIGVGLLQLLKPDDYVVEMWRGMLVLGAVLVVMGVAPKIWIAYLAAVAFGAASAYAIDAAMSGLQVRLDEEDRVLAFTVFHIGLRVALGIGAIAAGAVADILDGFAFDPVRVVMFGAGIVVVVAVIPVRGRLRDL
jgi:MFS family permease